MREDLNSKILEATAKIVRMTPSMDNIARFDLFNPMFRGLLGIREGNRTVSDEQLKEEITIFIRSAPLEKEDPSEIEKLANFLVRAARDTKHNILGVMMVLLLSPDFIDTVKHGTPYWFTDDGPVSP